MEEMIYRNFKILKLQESNIKDLNILWRLSFNTDVSEDFIKKKHLHCHGNNKYVGFIAYDIDTNDPAAYYGVFPGYMKYKDKTILVAQSGDTMTNPKYQKQGLFVHLAKTTYDYCKSIGIHIITGLPNSNSHHGFIKYLNFIEMPPFSDLVFYENKFELYRITKKMQILTKLHYLHVKLLFRIFTRKGTFMENSNHMESDLLYMIHDSKYFKQKENNDNLFIKINKVDVWIRLTKNSIIIADIGTGLNGNERIIIKKLIMLLKLTGLRFLSFGSTKNSFLVKQLENYAKIKSDGFKFIILKLNDEIIPIENIALLNSDADVF
jgi:GNAT superfamily N-acetyltransferase